jgi:hypothetical protein
VRKTPPPGGFVCSGSFRRGCGRPLIKSFCGTNDYHCQCGMSYSARFLLEAQGRPQMDPLDEGIATMLADAARARRGQADDGGGSDEAETPAAEWGHCLTCGRAVYRPNCLDVAECWNCKNTRLQFEDDPGPERDEEDHDVDPQG